MSTVIISWYLSIAAVMTRSTHISNTHISNTHSPIPHGHRLPHSPHCLYAVAGLVGLVAYLVHFQESNQHLASRRRIIHHQQLEPRLRSSSNGAIYPGIDLGRDRLYPRVDLGIDLSRDRLDPRIRDEPFTLGGLNISPTVLLTTTIVTFFYFITATAALW
jgi:hypothetical protein